MKKPKLDQRPKYMKEHAHHTFFMGYKVTESGMVFNRFNHQLKPKFAYADKEIRDIYIVIRHEGKNKYYPYHRFIYLAWNKDCVDNDNLVVVPIRSKFDYRLCNLKAITKQEQLLILQHDNRAYSKEEASKIVTTFDEVKDIMSKKEFCERLGISTRTFDRYKKENTTCTI